MVEIINKKQNKKTTKTRKEQVNLCKRQIVREIKRAQ